MAEQEHIGMKTTWAIDAKTDEGEMMRAITNEVKAVMNFDWTGDCEEYSNNPRWVKRDSQKFDGMSGDGINTIKHFCYDVKAQINAKDYDKQGFAGNSGHCRFMKPYGDAQARTFIETASFYEARVAGIRAMCEHYGVQVPAWMP